MKADDGISSSDQARGKFWLWRDEIRAGMGIQHPPTHGQQLFMGTPEGHHQLPKRGSTLHLQVWAPPSPPRHLFWIESPTGKLLSYTVRVMPRKRSTSAGVSCLDFYNLMEVCLLLSKISITCNGSSPPHLVSVAQNLPEKKNLKLSHLLT